MITGNRLALLLALVVLAFPLCVPAAERETMTITWPSNAGGWTKTGEPALYKDKAIFDYMDGAGEVFLAFNFTRLVVQKYLRPGRQDIVAELYELATSEDAFGVFTWDRQDPDASIGQGSEFGGGMLRFWKGRYFVSVYGEGEGKDQEEAVLAIGRRLSSAITDSGRPPRIMVLFPDEGRVEGSLKFVRSHVLLNQRCFVSNENILGLDAHTEAAFARYDVGKKRTFVLVVAYPSGTAAQQSLASFAKAYSLNATGLSESEGNWTGAASSGRYLIVVLRAPGADIAARLINGTKAKLGDKP
jgi:hypothetical protein